MTVPLKRILPGWQKNFKAEYYHGLLSEILIPLSKFILSIETDSNTELTYSHLSRLQNEVNRLVNLYFVGRQGRPFIDQSPQSSYAIALSRAYANVIYEVLLAHQVWADSKLPGEFLTRWRGMNKRPMIIQHPDSLAQDIRTKASRLRAGEIAEYKKELRLRVAEIDDRNVLRVFSPNSQADIDPLRRWVDMPVPRVYIDQHNNPQSYSLSDLIWEASQQTRSAIDNVIQQGISEGISAVEMSERLERQLMPQARDWRIFKPYEDAVYRSDLEERAVYAENYLEDPTIARLVRGANLDDYSFAAMRLARTEISRGFNNASFTAAYNNPFVQAYDWALANTHPRVDICDTFATIDGSGNRLQEPMTMGAAAIPPAHPHCLCTGLPFIPDGSNELNRQLDAINQQVKALETGTLLPRMNSSIDEVSTVINDLLRQNFMQFLPIDIPIDRNITRSVIPF